MRVVILTTIFLAIVAFAWVVVLHLNRRYLRKEREVAPDFLLLQRELNRQVRDEVEGHVHKTWEEVKKQRDSRESEPPTKENQ